MAAADPKPTRAAHWVLCVVACACSSACAPRTDIVAKRSSIRDAQVDSGSAGCADTAACHDAQVDSGSTGCADAAACHDAQTIDAASAAGCDAAADCGATPVPADCAAQSCMSVASRTDFCSAAMPPTVVLGDSCDATGHARFEFAVCTCRGLVTNAGFTVDSLSAATPGSASVASNDEVRLGPDTRIDGSLYVTGMYGAAATPRVSGDIVENAAPACGCDPSRFLNTTALIGARAPDNDDARAQLTAASLNGFSNGQNLSLDCGRYYFDRVAGSGLLQIEARGRLAIFIAGDLALDDGFTLTLQNGSSAEIFVGGNVRVGGRLELSATQDGNRVLLAVHGTGTIDLTADAIIDGSIYAPRSEIVTRGTLELHGSLFVNRANLERATRVRYRALPPAREMCVR